MNNGLPQALAMMVPLRIEEYRRAGGPCDADLQRASAVSSTLGHKGDVLLFGGEKGEAGRLCAELADAIAVLAFVPGGVTCFGSHWESTGCEMR